MPQHLHRAREACCDAVQGFYLSKPLEEGAVEEFLRTWSVARLGEQATRREEPRSSWSPAGLTHVAALWSYDDQPRRGDPLLPGAAPAAIREALLPDDRAAFDAAYERALAVARESPDLADLFREIEQWRRVALLQRDRDGYRALVRRAAELLTGQPVPEDEPLAVTRARAGM